MPFILSDTSVSTMLYTEDYGENIKSCSATFGQTVSTCRGFRTIRVKRILIRHGNGYSGLRELKKLVEKRGKNGIDVRSSRHDHDFWLPKLNIFGGLIFLQRNRIAYSGDMQQSTP